MLANQEHQVEDRPLCAPSGREREAECPLLQRVKRVAYVTGQG